MDLEKFFNDVIKNNSEDKSGLIAVSRYLSTYPVNAATLKYYKKIIDSNVDEALSAILKSRAPESFFSTIEPSYELISGALDTLSKFRTNELILKSLYISLGVLSQSYKHSKSGFKIYKLSVSDIHHISKHLLINDQKSEKMIIELLESVWNNDIKNEVSVLSINIVNAYFDNAKSLGKYIPEQLLI